MKSRLVSITVALAGVAGLSLLLAIDAARRTTRHEATARQVMHDYAALGAEGLAQRLQISLAGRVFAVLNALNDSLPTSQPALSARLAPAPAALAQGTTWVGQFTLADRASATGLQVVRFDSAAVEPPDFVDSLLSATSRLTQSAYMGTMAAGEEFVVYAKPRVGVPTGVFAISAAALGVAVQRMIVNDAVLPRALTHDSSLGALVQVDVKLRDAVIASRGASGQSQFRAEQSVDGPFADLSVVVSIADSAAPLLIPGGVPSSSRALIGTALVLTLVLVGVALKQVQQRDRLAALREDFVTGTSHELRTPLAQIRLFAETLQLGRLRNDEERVHAVSVIEREAKRLEHLVDNLLHFSRSETLRPHLQRETANAAALTKEIVGEFLPLAVKADVSISMDGVIANAAQVDSMAWRQILLNLLDNAVKYGGRRSTVTVELTESASDVMLVVSDQGPGVPPGERNDIWTKFWRADSVRTSGISGAGIGLATVHDLVRQLGGVCSVDDAKTNGARFHVRVPKSS